MVQYHRQQPQLKHVQRRVQDTPKPSLPPQAYIDKTHTFNIIARQPHSSFSCTTTLHFKPYTSNPTLQTQHFHHDAHIARTKPVRLHTPNTMAALHPLPPPHHHEMAIHPPAAHLRSHSTQELYQDSLHIRHAHRAAHASTRRRAGARGRPHDQRGVCGNAAADLLARRVAART